LEDLTKDGSTQFVKPTGGRLKADGTGTQILNCNRTGIPRSTSDPDRTKGSSKIGVTCPAHIRVFYNRDKYDLIILTCTKGSRKSGTGKLTPGFCRCQFSLNRTKELF
jgi:hypothetical protein